LEGWILQYFDYYFSEPFAIYNIKGKNESIVENKILKDIKALKEGTEDKFETILKYKDAYLDICNKF